MLLIIWKTEKMNDTSKNELITFCQGEGEGENGTESKNKNARRKLIRKTGVEKKKRDCNKNEELTF